LTAAKSFRMWWPETGSNRRRRPFQGRALPLSYLASVQLQDGVNLRGNRPMGGHTALLQRLVKYSKRSGRRQTLRVIGHNPLVVFFVGRKMPLGDHRISSASTAVLLLLSLVLACSALKADLMPGLAPNLVPHLGRQVIPLALLALAAAIVAVVRRAKWPGGRQLSAPVLIGLGLFAAPAILVSFSSGWVPGSARTALFTLVPVFAVVFEPYIGSASGGQQRGGLATSLIAVVGALLVFPIVIPATLEAGEAIVAVVLAAASIAAANCLGVATAARLGRNSASFAAIVAVAAATAAISDGLASAFLERTLWNWSALAPELFWAAATEVPALLLLVWLMPRISATQLTTRYLWAPLLAILIGAAVLQSLREFRPRTWLGLSLMAVGAAWLLFAPSEEAGANRLPLKLDR
jgi:hypothetical protein